MYYLRLFFNPDIHPDKLPEARAELKPVPVTSLANLPGSTSSRVNARELGYVINVLPHQPLAELVPLESEKNPDSRFIRQTLELPKGKNTMPSLDSPLRLVASAPGYVRFENDLITVKTVLTVRSDVNFHTGNIDFCGNIHILHSIASGFRVRGNDVLVDGGISGARVRAHHDLAARGGARGDFRVNCVLNAGRNLRLVFTDKAELRARNNLDVENALHSHMLVGGNLLVRHNLNGGICRVRGSAVIQGDLGNSSLTSTSLYLEDEPFLAQPLKRCQERLEQARRVTARCEPLARHLPPDANDLTRRLAKARRLATALEKQFATLLAARQTSLNAIPPNGSPKSCLYVSGTTHPGVLIVIGGIRFAVETPLHHTRFHREGETVLASPMAAS